MEMTNDEIVVRYRQAKKKGEQVQILADLNSCSVGDIIEILVAAGVDRRNFSRLIAKMKKEKKQPEAKKPAAENELAAALAIIYDRVRELNEQKANINGELAEISVMINRLDDFIAGRSD